MFDESDKACLESETFCCRWLYKGDVARANMISQKTASQRREMFKTKGPNWKDVVRSQKLLRSKAMRGKRLESARQSVIQNIQLEDDLQLEQDLLGEKFEQEYGLSNEFDIVDHPCPICGQELLTTRDSQPCAIGCKTCDFSTEFGWKEFEQCLRMALSQHSQRGCTSQAEVITLEGDLFIACEICDYLEAASE